MSKPIFKVWIEIEMEDANGDHESLDSAFGSSARFSSEADAQAFAWRLNEVARVLAKGVNGESIP